MCGFFFERLGDEYVFERLGDEYFSWGYVQHMLSYGITIISLDTFVWYFYFAIVFEMPDQNGHWYQHLQTLFAIV